METELATEDPVPDLQVPEPGGSDESIGFPQAFVSEGGGGPVVGAPSELSIDEIDNALGDVERALGRLDDGTYGRCRLCGAPIDDVRLAAMPTEQTCATCEPITSD